MNPMSYWFFSIILASIATHVLYALGAGTGKLNPKTSHLLVGDFSNLPAHFSDTYGSCGRKHVLSLSVVDFKKKKRSPRKVFDNLTKFLTILKGSKINFVKRATQRNDHIVRCLQKSAGTITCFGRGRFYTFNGDLKKIVDQTLAKERRKREWKKKKMKFCSCGRQPEQNLQTKPLSNKGVFKTFQPVANFESYQEVMMEPIHMKNLPLSCYGFVSPLSAFAKPRKCSEVHSTAFDKESSLRKSQSIAQRSIPNSSASSKLKNCQGKTISYVKGENRTASHAAKHQNDVLDGATGRIHLIGKRSQIVTLACPPLYVPTPVPSINEGRVPQCRIPCGAHNCRPLPTCPCRPPTRTPPPPLTTCPPIPGVEEETTVVITRCPPYEFTDEPCPTFECKDGCPYLTTPGCSSSSPSTAQLKGVACKGKPAISANISEWSFSTTREGRESNGRSVVVTAKIHPSSNPVKFTDATKTPAVTGKHRNGLPGRSSRAELVDSKFGSKIPGLWSNFDFKKLLKSAKSHYKEKAAFLNEG